MYFALQVNGYKFPTCQIVVNMAPADIRKEVSHKQCFIGKQQHQERNRKKQSDREFAKYADAIK